MADYSLKDEKRINTNGEWDKVTTHPNNEPIFRQNGHELVFESANSDYLETSIPLVTSDVIQIRYSLTKEIDSSVSRCIITGTTNSFRVYYTGGPSSPYLNPVGVSVLSYEIDGVSYPTTENINNHIGKEIVLSVSLTVSDTLRGVFWRRNNTDFTDGIIYEYSINGTNYPLTEGLGNTTNGATINTSHADGIERINFGMWLKGDDVGGWTPYTIV